MRAALLCLALTLGFVGCGGDDEDDKPPATCEGNCERKAAAKCPNTQADFVATCKQQCTTSRQAMVEACRDELARIHACLATKTTYKCNAAGDFYSDPLTNCTPELTACATCGGGLQCAAL